MIIVCLRLLGVCTIQEIVSGQWTLQEPSMNSNMSLQLEHKRFQNNLLHIHSECQLKPDQVRHYHLCKLADIVNFFYIACVGASTEDHANHDAGVHISGSSQHANSVIHHAVNIHLHHSQRIHSCKGWLETPVTLQ